MELFDQQPDEELVQGEANQIDNEKTAGANAVAVPVPVPIKTECAVGRVADCGEGEEDKSQR